MRSVLFIVYTLRFWYKTDMHPLQYFFGFHAFRLEKKTVNLEPKIQVLLNY